MEVVFLVLIVNNIIRFVVTGRAVVLVVGGAVDAARSCCCCYCFVGVGVVVVVVVVVVDVVYRFNIALFHALEQTFCARMCFYMSD